jgi:hypothetical protein
VLLPMNWNLAPSVPLLISLVGLYGQRVGESWAEFQRGCRLSRIARCADKGDSGTLTRLLRKHGRERPTREAIYRALRRIRSPEAMEILFAHLREDYDLAKKVLAETVFGNGGQA